MIFRGHFKNGHIILDDSVTLPDGTPVEVRRASSARRRGPKRGKAAGRTLLERLGPIVGAIKGPKDLARNHDRYVRHPAGGR